MRLSKDFKKIMLRLSAAFLNNNSNINCSNINCSNINCSNINFINNSNINIGKNVINANNYIHNKAALILTNQTPTGSTLNDSLPILNLCRMNTNTVSIGARATFCISRAYNFDIGSYTLLDLKLLDDATNTNTPIQFYSSGEVKINGNLTAKYIVLYSDGIIKSPYNYSIEFSNINKKILLRIAYSSSIFFSIGTTKTNKVSITSTDFIINNNLSINNNATINANLTVNGNIISDGRWIKASNGFSSFNTNQYIVGFNFSAYSTLLKNKTYLCDCHITYGGVKTSAAYGFTQIVTNTGDTQTQNGGIYKNLYNHNIAAIDWFSAGTWNNSLNIYVNTSSPFNGAVCNIVLVCLH